MKLFNNNIVPYASTEGDKIYPIVVDIKKGIKSGEAISFVTADNQVGVITVDFMDGNSSYSIEGCMVTSTIRRPDGTVLEIPCDIISQSTIEIPLGINGTYQEGTHTFDLKIVRGNGKVIGVPTMSYSVSGSLSSDDVVEGDDRLPVLTMVLDNAQDKLTRLDRAIAGATNDLEVKEARDGEVTLNARLERDLKKGKIHFADIEGSSVSTESEEGYLENIEIYGNTWQDANNLSDIRSVGTKVEGQELHEIPVLSCGKNLFDISSKPFAIADGCFVENGTIYTYSDNKTYNGVNYRVYGIKELTKYTLQCNGINRGQIEIRPITIDGTTIGGGAYTVHATPNTSNPVSITTPVGTKGLSITFNNQIKLNTKFDFKDIILVEGGECTYEPYKEDKLTILSPTPLEKVGDVADRIICKDGVYGVEKNIYTITSDVFYKHTPNMWYVSESKCPVWVSKNIWNMIENKIMCNYYSEVATYVDVENGVGIFIDHKGTHPNIIIGTGDETITSLPEDLEVKYQLVQPQFIPLPHDQQIKLRTFADRTHIHFDTEIEPTLKAQVPKSLGATVNTHTTQIDNLNKELDRVKKLEESTVSTVTTDKAFTTVAETTQGYFEDVKVEGKTLVNLVLPTYASDDRIRRSQRPLTSYSVQTFVNLTGREVSVGYYNYNSVWLRSRVVEAGEVFISSSANEYVKDCIGFFGNGFTSTESLKILILEGDHTDKDISYFEGLKSVGQGADEISIESINENLLNVSEMKLGHIDWGNGTETELDGRKISKFIPLPNKVDVIYATNKSGLFDIKGIVFYDKNKNHISSRTDTSTFEIPYGAKYIKVELEISKGLDICISAKNTYSEYKQDKKQILYFNPTTQTWEKPILREWDSIEKHDDGKYYYHKRSEEVVLNGSESWSKSSVVSTDTVRFVISLGDNKHNIAPICDIFKGQLYTTDDVEGAFIGTSTNLGISILKTKLSTQDMAGFKSWLQANPTTVVYQLAQEEVYECTNLDLITYSNETNLIVNSGAIQPRITLKVLSNISNVVKLLQEKVSILENKFIEGLKQVLSGDMMSLAHLLYPEDFEHEIQTLEL